MARMGVYMKNNKVIIIIGGLIVAVIITLVAITFLGGKPQKNNYIESVAGYDFVGIINNIDLLILEMDTLNTNDIADYQLNLNRILDEIKIKDTELGTSLDAIKVDPDMLATHNLLITYHLKNQERIADIEKMINLYNEISQTPADDQENIKRIYEDSIDTMDEIVALSTEADSFKEQWLAAYNLMLPASEVTTEPVEEPATEDMPANSEDEISE